MAYAEFFNALFKSSGDLPYHSKIVVLKNSVIARNISDSCIKNRIVYFKAVYCANLFVGESRAVKTVKKLLFAIINYEVICNAPAPL